jgi:3-oxoacyl-[acyl-carrier protein] reductase
VVVALDMPISELQAGELSGTLLVDHLQEQDHRFEAVKQGDVASFDLRWGGDQLRAYEDLLRLAAQDAKEPLPTDLLRGRDPGAFAMLATLSTLVGMVMPGRSATFQEFSLTMDGPLQEAPAQATLRSTVSFRSSTINTFSQEVVIGSGSETYAHGKVTVLVAKTPFVPPTIQELAEGHQDMGLRNKVVLITGGSRGLGATTAKLFAVHGARVVINYRSSSAEAEELVAEIEAYGGEALAVQADVSSAAEVQRMVKEAVTHFGTIDVLVNGAASNFFPIPFLETTWDRIQDDLDVIVKGAFQVSQAVIPEFLRKGGGRIINISTIAVETPPPFQTKYVVAKSALNGLTRALAAEYAGQNILVNMVVPSLVETDFTSGFNQVALGKLKAASPLKRLAQAQEVADAIVFLASSRSSFTTGQKLMVTGGLPPLL